MINRRKELYEEYYTLRLFNGVWQVEKQTERGLQWDNHNYMMGNYFRTLGQAETAITMIQNFMKNNL